MCWESFLLPWPLSIALGGTGIGCSQKAWRTFHEVFHLRVLPVPQAEATICELQAIAGRNCLGATVAASVQHAEALKTCIISEPLKTLNCAARSDTTCRLYVSNSAVSPSSMSNNGMSKCPIPWLSPVPNPSRVLTTQGSSIAMRCTMTCPATGLKHMIENNLIGKCAATLPLRPNKINITILIYNLTNNSLTEKELFPCISLSTSAFGFLGRNERSESKGPKTALYI